MKKIRKILPLLLILVLAAVLRLLWLDRVPSAIVDDELDYIFNAKAIFLSGKEIGQFPQAELPAWLISPLIGPLKFSLFNARLPYVIFGLVFIIFIYLFSQKLFGNKIALIAVSVAAINPWHIYFSRTSFDVLIAGTFYLIAIYSLLFLKGWKLLFSLPVLILAFFSYIGTKIIFVPLVFISCFYGWFVINKKKFTRQYLVVFLLVLLIFGWFLINLKRLPISSRAGELLTPFSSVVSQEVDTERRLSISTPLTLIFSNKIIVWGRLFLEKYFGIFSANFLFLHGEARSTYSMWAHGMFYYLDFLFLVLGVVFLFYKNRRLWCFIITLILLAPIPSAITTIGIEYSLRAVLAYPIFILLIGLGIWAMFSFIKSKFCRCGAVVIVIIFYLFQLLNFLNIYFFRNPIYNPEGFGFSKRVLFHYVKLISPTVKRVNIFGANLGYLKGYLFYSGNFNKKALIDLKFLISKGEYSWGNIYFFPDCPERVSLNPDEVTIIPEGNDCLAKNQDLRWLSIAQLSDGGEIFRIFNDSLCYQYNLSRYPWGIKLSDFEVEKLSQMDFCQKYITDLTGYAEFKKSSGEK